MHTSEHTGKCVTSSSVCILVRLTCFLLHVSSFFLFYSVPETCGHVAKTERLIGRDVNKASHSKAKNLGFKAEA